MPSQRYVVVGSNRHGQSSVFGPFIETDARAFVGEQMSAHPRLDWVAHPLHEASTITILTITQWLEQQGARSATQLLKEGSA